MFVIIILVGVFTGALIPCLLLAFLIRFAAWITFRFTPRYWDSYQAALITVFVSYTFSMAIQWLSDQSKSGMWDLLYLSFPIIGGFLFGQFLQKVPENKGVGFLRGTVIYVTYGLAILLLLGIVLAIRFYAKQIA
ncbi:MAG: hypothetical protein ABFD91_14055 [Anaerohalosphaeraceae bacterium]